MFEKNTPRDFFLHAGAFITLYFSAIALLTLLFGLINYSFPDMVYGGYYGDPYSGTMRFAIASLVILTPISVYLFYLIQNAARQIPERRTLGIRKWLTYITLFVAGATVIGDLIVLLNSFLGGSSPTPFLLKVLAVLVIAGAGFTYFFFDIRGYWQEHADHSKYVGAGVLLVVLASIVGGMMLIGSPTTQRELRLDAEEINDLSMIQYQVVDYRRSTGKLPENMAVFESAMYSVPVAPEGRPAYEYKKVNENSFELCATFAEASLPNTYTDAIDPSLGTIATWEHEAGPYCFTRTIDPDYFKTLQVAPSSMPIKM